MPETKSQFSAPSSACSSPLSSPPSTYESLPSSPVIPERPQLASAPLPNVSDPSVRDTRGLNRPSIVVERVDVDSDVGKHVAKSPGQDSAIGAASDALGMLLEQGHRLADQERAGGSNRISTRLGDQSERRLLPLNRVVSANRLALSNLSSLSSNFELWPTSPLANKGKFPSSNAGKRKRLVSERDQGIFVGSTENVDTKKARWVSPRAQAVANDENRHPDTSPDYRAMLNLSSTPSQFQDAPSDPFAQHVNLAPSNKSAFQLSVSRDVSLSPTIKNTSVGSLDSEDLSIACLVRDDHRSPSDGLLACSGFLEDQEGKDVVVSAEVEKRRLVDVMERWAKGQNLDTTIELYRAPEPPSNLILAPPRPLDRNTLAQFTRALEDRSRGEPSRGLLDIVCDNEALMHEWNAGMGWPVGSLAPRDMHIQPKRDTVKGLELDRGKAEKSVERRADRVAELLRKDEEVICDPAQVYTNEKSWASCLQPSPTFETAQASALGTENKSFEDFARPVTPPTTVATGPGPNRGVSNNHRGFRKLRLTQSGATLAVIVKETSPIDFIPFQSLSIGCWHRYPKATAEQMVETSFAYTPFEGGDRRFSWVMFHDDTHYRISVPFVSIASLKCDDTPEMPTSLTLVLKLKQAPIFDVWNAQVGQWCTINSFIHTDDLLTHRLTCDRKSLVPKIQRIIERLQPQDEETSMFRQPYRSQPVVFAPIKPALAARPAFATANPTLAPRPAFATRPKIKIKARPKLALATSEVIDLITPPKSSAAAQAAEAKPETPGKGSPGLRKSQRLLEKTKLGRDSSCVKISGAAPKPNQVRSKVQSSKADSQQSAVSEGVCMTDIHPVNAAPASLGPDNLPNPSLSDYPPQVARANALPQMPRDRAPPVHYQPTSQPYLQYASFPAYHDAQAATSSDTRPRPYGLYLYPYSRPLDGNYDPHFAMQPPQNGYYTSTQYFNPSSAPGLRPGTTSSSASTVPVGAKADSSQRATSSTSRITDVSTALTGHMPNEL